MNILKLFKIIREPKPKPPKGMINKIRIGRIDKDKLHYYVNYMFDDFVVRKQKLRYVAFSQGDILELDFNGESVKLK